MNTEEITIHLRVLEIYDDIAVVTIQDVNLAFKKLATVIHPDKAGEDSTAAFQELLNSCHILRKYFKDKQRHEQTAGKNKQECSDHDKFF